MKLMKRFELTSLIMTALLALSACSGSRFGKVAQPMLVDEEGESAPMRFAGGSIYKIGRVVVEKGAKAVSARVFFDTFKDFPGSFAGKCDTSGKPCLCEFSWTEQNSTTGVQRPISRKVQTPVSNVTESLAECLVPGAWDTEITNGTQLKVEVIPGAGNPSKFQMLPKKFSKGTQDTRVSFRDAQGRAFDNVLRYSCFDRSTRGQQIKSKVKTVSKPDDNSTTAQVPMASEFCVAGKDGRWIGGPECGDADNAPSAPSSQSYFYNLYIRDKENGDINLGNDKYTCPQVDDADKMHPVRNNWPLDATFAVALGPSPEFTVPIEAFTKVSSASDPVSAGSTCYPSGGEQAPLGSGNNSSLVKSCLGFGAKPKSDMSCPIFKDQDGAPLPTYRLRRYIALYPPHFTASGYPADEPQASDTIYVIDRPVNVAGRSADKPAYTILGPKPCPFAFFDKAKATSMDSGDPLPAYVATNDEKWNGKNVDGLQFPNIDSKTSCAAALPIPNDADDMGVFSFATVHAKNRDPRFHRVFVRPIKPWAPHYVEDTEFQACAPLARPFKDPPLHFAKAGNNMQYCAEAYPTQNNRVSDLERTTPPLRNGQNNIGRVKPFTSHEVKSIPTSPACRGRPLNTVNGTTFPAGYPGDGQANHPNSGATCDRTVISSAGNTWGYFPLLADAASTEKALRDDFEYGCIVTWEDPGSEARIGVSTPAGGCCGRSIMSPDSASAHLEPGTACLAPEYN